MSQQDDLKAMFDFLEQAKPMFARAEQRSYAREMRNQTTANWLDNFINTQIVEAADPSLNKETGLRHTVESMVEEYKKRVGLHVLTKEAGIERVALSKRAKYRTHETSLDEIADDALLAKIKDEVERIAINPSSGYVNTEVLLDVIKETFGDEIVERFGRKELSDFLAKIRDEHLDTSMVDNLPKYDGSPIPAETNPANEQENISGAGKKS